MTRSDAGSSDPRVIVDPASVGGRCDDSRSLRDALSPQTPLCTLARALSVTRGRRVRIAARAGSYPRLVVRGRRFAHAYLTLEPYGDGRVRLAGVTIAPSASHFRLRGVRLGSTGARTPAFWVREGAHRLRLQGTRIDNGAEAVRLEAGSHDVLIQRNWMRSGGQANAIDFNSTSSLPPISRVTIRGNRIAGAGTDAIRPANFRRLLIEGNDISGVVERGGHSDVLQTVWGGRGLVFRRNLVHDNAGQGFFIKDGRVRDVVVAGNVFARNTRGAQIQVYDTIGLRIVNNTVWGDDYGVALRSDVRDVTVRNNIFDSLVVYGPRARMEREITQDHNLIAAGWNWGARGARDSAARPRFADPDELDYSPAPGSPAIDAGSGRDAPRLDAACRPRVRSVDIGALEFRPGSKGGRKPRAC